MSSFRDFQELCVLSYCNKFISDTEFCLLYDHFTSKNPDFSYDTYPPFSLEDVEEAECKAEFRVLKHDLPRVRDAHLQHTFLFCSCDSTAILELTNTKPNQIFCQNDTYTNLMKGIGCYMYHFTSTKLKIVDKIGKYILTFSNNAKTSNLTSARTRRRQNSSSTQAHFVTDNSASLPGHVAVVVYRHAKGPY